MRRGNWSTWQIDWMVWSRVGRSREVRKSKCKVINLRGRFTPIEARIITPIKARIIVELSFRWMRFRLASMKGICTLLGLSWNLTLSCQRLGELRQWRVSWRSPMWLVSTWAAPDSSTWFCRVLTESGGLLFGLVAQLIGGGKVVTPRDGDVFICRSKRALLHRRGWEHNTDLFDCSSDLECWTGGRQAPLLCSKKLSGVQIMIEKQINRDEFYIKKLRELACGYT